VPVRKVASEPAMIARMRPRVRSSRTSSTCAYWSPSVVEAVVKVPSNDVRLDPVWMKKFEREARISGNIPEHPNVVKVLAVWRFTDGELAVVQEFVHNAKTFSSYVGDVNVDRVDALLQALYALRAVHGSEDEGIVHRDIAPSNILVDSVTGIVKLIDFGLAIENPRVTEVLTGTGTYFGTPGCVSPEQRKDPRDVDKRSDLWSLGKVFAGGLRGVDPEFAEPHKLPPPWRDICSSLCELDRGDRPQSADEALDLVIQAVTAQGMSVTNLQRHIDEVNRSSIEPRGWPAFCNQFFQKRIRMDTLAISDLHVAVDLRVGVLSDPEFDGDSLFDAIETGSIAEHFESRSSSFSGVDPLGQYLRNAYSGLSRENKVRCFRRLVRTAVDYHRYELMDHVRALYGKECDPSVSRDLLVDLAKEDPDEVIQGRGVIPR